MPDELLAKSPMPPEYKDKPTLSLAEIAELERKRVVGYHELAGNADFAENPPTLDDLSSSEAKEAFYRAKEAQNAHSQGRAVEDRPSHGEIRQKPQKIPEIPAISSEIASPAPENAVNPEQATLVQEFINEVRRVREVLLPTFYHQLYTNADPDIPKEHVEQTIMILNGVLRTADYAMIERDSPMMLSCLHQMRNTL